MLVLAVCVTNKLFMLVSSCVSLTLGNDINANNVSMQHHLVANVQYLIFMFDNVLICPYLCCIYVMNESMLQQLIIKLFHKRLWRYSTCHNKHRMWGIFGLVWKRSQSSSIQGIRSWTHLGSTLQVNTSISVSKITRFFFSLGQTGEAYMIEFTLKMIVITLMIWLN